MHHGYTILALDLARQRAREAEQARLARRAMLGRPWEPGLVRRRLAAALALVARGASAGVRRLDDCTADDLARSLGATR